MPISSDRSNCERCTQQASCHGATAGDQLPGQRMRIERNASLFQSGTEVGNRLYNIRSGSFKLVQEVPNAGRQVIGFYLAPEYIGLSDLASARHQCSAIALEDSEVCCISWDSKALFGRRQPMRQPQLFALLASQIREQFRLQALLQRARAEHRLADMLWALSQQHQRNGYSATRFRLPMTHTDIASYVGITTECLSRLIGQFRQRLLLEVHRREVILLDLPALKRLASQCAA